MQCYVDMCHFWVLRIAPERAQELQEKLFDKNRQFLTKYLKPDDIIDYLISNHLVGDTARQLISSPYNTPGYRNGIIVDELRRGQPGTVEKFCKILKKSRMTQHIADRLEKGLYVYLHCMMLIMCEIERYMVYVCDNSHSIKALFGFFSG